jgi:hypothetical protein
VASMPFDGEVRSWHLADLPSFDRWVENESGVSGRLVHAKVVEASTKYWPKGLRGPIASCRHVRSGQRGPATDTRYPHKRDDDAECARVLLARNIQPLWLAIRRPSTLSPCLLIIKP